jgi:2-desacetyl-2-hydroxyethyl bacteriochlorophyllide A dehydrogenase
MSKCQSVIFQAPLQIAIAETAVPTPAAGEVLLQTVVSAISPGTEMLFYRGQVPAEMAVDATIAALGGQFAYPLPYGYALVGRVCACGPGVADSWLDRLVFAFAPHQSHVVLPLTELIPVPDGMAPETAVLLPLMETAVSFLMDAAPLIGEQVAVFGQGIVGLLTTTLLAGYPLNSLVALDSWALRRSWALELGAGVVVDPAAPQAAQELAAALQGGRPYRGADLVFELSGNPQALNMAIAAAGFDGRILVGSWYGRKQAPLDLGGHFHRSQISVVSSQVSHIAPRLRGRFSKERRLQVAWEMLARHRPERLITHRFAIGDAAQAYALLHEQPETAVQVLIDYQDS